MFSFKALELRIWIRLRTLRGMGMRCQSYDWGALEKENLQRSVRFPAPFVWSSFPFVGFLALWRFQVSLNSRNHGHILTLAVYEWAKSCGALRRIWLIFEGIWDIRRQQLGRTRSSSLHPTLTWMAFCSVSFWVIAMDHGVLPCP